MIDLLLREPSLVKSTTMGARVAPPSPVGCKIKGQSKGMSLSIMSRYYPKKNDYELTQLTSAGCPIRLFNTADLPAP